MGQVFYAEPSIMISVLGCKVDRSAGRSHLASREPAGIATGGRAAGRPNPASLVTPATLVQYSGGDDGVSGSSPLVGPLIFSEFDRTPTETTLRLTLVTIR
jgi:hypothetical protein